MDHSATPHEPVGTSSTHQGTAVFGNGSIEPGGRTFVWSVFVLMIIVDLLYVTKYTPRVPAFDDYEMVPSYTGERKLTIEWLWSLSNEHRVFLPRLIHIVNFRLSGGDFRVSTYVSLASLVLAAAFLIEVAGRRRGYLRYADAFFPLIVLGLGQWSNLIWAWQVVQIAPPAIACVLLGLIVLRQDWPTARKTVPFAFGLTLLPLLSGTGLILSLPLLGWLLISALANWSSGKRLQGALILSLSLPATALILLYFKGYKRPSYIPQPGAPYEIFKTVVQFLTIGFGSSAKMFWPSMGLLTLGAVGLSVLVLMFVIRRIPSERPRAIGLLTFLGACGALALAVGINRSGFGYYAGLAERYVSPAVPILCWAYFVWELYGPGITRPLVPLGLFLATILLFMPNLRDAREGGRGTRDVFAEYEKDIREGPYIYQIARRYSALILGDGDPTSYLEALQRARIRPFDRLQKNPVFREVTIPVVPSATENASWDETTKTIEFEGRDSRVTFTLPEAMRLAGIRLNYSLEGSPGCGSRFVISWRPTENDAYSSERTLKDSSVRIGIGQNLRTTFWVDDMIRQFRIVQDKYPCKFQINSIKLLVP